MSARHIIIGSTWATLTSFLLLALFGDKSQGHSAPWSFAMFFILMLSSLAASLPLSWWTCRLFHLQPMGIWNPACPHCGERPPGWWMIARHRRARRDYACGLCGGVVELWIQGRVPRDRISRDIPSYQLRPPRFCGHWRRLAPEPPAAPAPGDFNHAGNDTGHLSYEDLAAELRSAIADLIQAIETDDCEAVRRATLHPTMLARLSAEKRAAFATFFRSPEGQKYWTEMLVVMRLIAPGVPTFSLLRKRAWIAIPAGHPAAGKNVVFIRAQGRWHWKRRF